MAFVNWEETCRKAYNAACADITDFAARDRMYDAARTAFQNYVAGKSRIDIAELYQRCYSAALLAGRAALRGR